MLEFKTEKLGLQTGENRFFGFKKTPVYLVFTVRRYALHGLCDRNSDRPSVCHTRALCLHGSTYDHDYFTIW